MQKIYSYFKNHKFFSIAILTLLVAVALFLIVLSLLSASLNTDKNYDGISVGDLSVGGLTQEETAAAIEAYYGLRHTNSVTLSCGDQERILSLSEISAETDVSAITQEAYNIGRKGNIFKRLYTVSSLKENPVVLPPYITCDEEKLVAVFSELASFVDIPEQEMQIAINDNELVIKRGTPGKRILIDETVNLFKETVITLTDGLFVMVPRDVYPTEPNAQLIYNQIGGDPVDASYTIENYKLIIKEEKPGVEFDIDHAQAIIDSTHGDTIIIPAQTTRPTKTAEELKNSLFTDLLGTYTSRYSPVDVSRSHNVALASQKINEIVLAPGELFSYNDIVGPRTPEEGFRVANVYVGNKIEPGIGGGICQVSSTLFNAVVLSDLKIIYRTNHSLPVSYVPLGRDATVSYGSIDFKFANDSEAPIMIVASASGGVNKVSVYGTKENKNRTISISTEQISSQAPKLVQKEDNTLPLGTIEVEQEGTYGSTHHTYKITKENGSIVKSELLTKSVYVATDRIELIGTNAELAAETMSPAGTDEMIPSGTVNPAPEESTSVSETPASTDEAASPEASE